MISRLLDVARDRAGSVMVEFAFTAPALLVVLVGVLQFGIFYYDSVALTDATAAGIRQFSIGRLDPAPYTDTVNAIYHATCNPSSTACILNTANLTITTSICTGTPCTSKASWISCTSDTTCQSDLKSAYNATPPQPIGVTVSYSCTSFMPISWVNLSSICPMAITLTGRAQ